MVSTEKFRKTHKKGSKGSILYTGNIKWQEAVSQFWLTFTSQGIINTCEGINKMETDMECL